MSVQFLCGKYDEAISIWEKELKNNPNDTTLLCNIAACYYELEMYRKCSVQCDKVIKIDDRYIHAYIIQGLSFLKRNKIEIAVAVWKCALDKTKNILLIQQLCSLIDNPQNTLLNQQNKVNNNIINNISSNTTTNKQNTNEQQFQLQNASKISEDEYTTLKAATQELARKGLIEGNENNFDIDKHIALGFLQVNSGKLEEAIGTFQLVISLSNTIPLAAVLGRGTALALKGDLDSAIKDFSIAINQYPKYDDAWKRRAQARAAQGNLIDAISDMDHAIELKPDFDSYFQRGLIYYKQKNYKKAREDFQKTKTMKPDFGQAYVQYGLCQLTLGNPKDAIDHFDISFTYDPISCQTLVYKGQTFKEIGDYENSYSTYSKGLELEPNNSNCLYMRGMSSFSVGKHHLAIQDFTKALKLDSTLLDCRKMNAVAHHGIGKIRKAIEEYNIICKMDPAHVCWYNREIALYLAHHLDDPITSFHLDKDLHPHMKEAWCKRLDPKTLPLSYIPQKPLPSSFKDVTQKDSFKPSNNLTKILEVSKIFGPQLQLNCPGYSKNLRQWRMCGLAVLDFAQQLKSFWKDCRNNKENKSLTWRHFYDILVHWRQYSEPNDCVVWVDLLTPEQFEEGFGSHTPMITGQTWVVRYSPMFYKSFPIMKNEIHQTNISKEKQEQFKKIETIEEAYEIVGHDFWICTPCHSTKYPDKIYEGTRLTLQYIHPDGYEYSIRTPGTPKRWQQYTEELDYLFDELKKAVIDSNQDLDKISDLILTITFYWYNFMPLARGTAACGYIGLLGMFLSIDYEIRASIPEKQQPDWEGILNPHPSIFIKALKPWMYPARTKTTILNNLPSISKTLNTLRKRIEALNCDF